MRQMLLGLVVVTFTAVSHGRPADDVPKQVFPRIEKHGGVVAVPKGAEPPRKGAKIVFDITAGGKPDEVNKGLDRVARCVNLYAAAGVEAQEMHVTLVLHGDATLSALSDDAYRRRTGSEHNPNLPLLKALRKVGVQTFVCGQALAYKGYPTAEVDREMTIAVAAMTVVVNRQTEGFAYLPIH